MRAFLRYALETTKRQAEERVYRVYVAETLYFMARGEAPTVRFNDLIHPKPQDTRTSEEIIDTMKTKLNRLEAM